MPPKTQSHRTEGLRRVRFRRAGLVFVVLVAGVLAKGFRAYQHSRDGFRPPRGPIAIPRDLLALGPVEAVRFRIPNGIDVHGWYVPSRTRASVLFVHGSPGTRKDLLPEAESLIGAGYGVLLIDVPGHGESSGPADWGQSASDAVRGSVTFLWQRPDVDPRRIGAFGFSMGSSVVAEVAAEDRRIAAVVLTGLFADQVEQIEHEFRRWGAITQWPAVWAAREEGIALDRLKPRTFIARLAPTPALFVTGTDDTTVPSFMTQEVFDLAGAPKEWLSVKGAHHGAYAAAPGTSYLGTLRAFFDRHLGPH